MSDVTYTLNRHQRASLNSLLYYPKIPYIFLIGGFGCGKSFTVGQLCLYLYHCYKDIPITVGIFGVTIKLLRQTVIQTLHFFFDQCGIPYRDNVQSSTLTVGKLTFVYLAMQDPEDIYAYNFNCAFVDEIDEVDPTRIPLIVTAIQERCRITLPYTPHSKSLSNRSPFIFFSTTAQGMKGVYAFIQTLNERNIPYIKIRGRTIDNPLLDPNQVKLLTALYSEDERRAFLDGEFVNLCVGRVYPTFDRLSSLITPFKIFPSDTLYCGQDFNLGFNACVILIERSKVLYCIGEYHWNYVGEAPFRLRELYPKNKIVFIPDASGKEIMSGFVDEFTNNNITLHWNTTNPSISERIMVVNKMFLTKKLFVFNTLTHLATSLEIRDYDQTGIPRKGKGKEAPDHCCDALEYALWHVVHGIKGFDTILSVLRKVG